MVLSIKESATGGSSNASVQTPAVTLTAPASGRNAHNRLECVNDLPPLRIFPGAEQITAMNPFSVEKITNSNKTNDSIMIVTIGFDKKKVKQIFNRAVLRINSETDNLDIPILAMGRVKE